jgi:hypothetical protein
MSILIEEKTHEGAKYFKLERISCRDFITQIRCCEQEKVIVEQFIPNAMI